MSAIIMATDESFDQEVLQAKTPVLLYFRKDNDPDCDVMDATINALAFTNTLDIKIVTLNASQNLEIPEDWSIPAFPIVFFIHENTILGYKTGKRPLSDLSSWLKRTQETTKDDGITIEEFKDNLQQLKSKHRKEDVQKEKFKAKFRALTTITKIVGGVTLAVFLTASGGALFGMTVAGLAVYQNFDAKRDKSKQAWGRTLLSGIMNLITAAGGLTLLGLAGTFGALPAAAAIATGAVMIASGSIGVGQAIPSGLLWKNIIPKLFKREKEKLEKTTIYQPQERPRAQVDIKTKKKQEPEKSPEGATVNTEFKAKAQGEETKAPNHKQNVKKRKQNTKPDMS